MILGIYADAGGVLDHAHRETLSPTAALILVHRLVERCATVASWGRSRWRIPNIWAMLYGDVQRRYSSSPRIAGVFDAALGRDTLLKVPV